MVERAASVRETIRRSLDERGLGSYTREAEPVITALEEREVFLSNEIADVADEAGMPRDEALSTLRQLGMEVPSTNGASGDDDALTRIEHTLATVTDELAELRNRRSR